MAQQQAFAPFLMRLMSLMNSRRGKRVAPQTFMLFRTAHEAEKSPTGGTRSRQREPGSWRIDTLASPGKRSTLTGLPIHHKRLSPQPLLRALLRT